MKKRGQVSIFVILAIVGVSLISIAVFVYLSQEPNIEGEKPEENPKYFLENCVEEKLRESVDTISLQGGYIQKNLNITYKFENETPQDIAYLCYNRNYYLSCINQEPMLIQHLRNEIKEEIKDTVEDCFYNHTSTLEKQGYVVDASYRGFDVYLEYGLIIIDINGNIKLTRGGETTNQENLKISYRSSLYDLAEVAQEITNQEASYCNFDQTGYRLLNRNININKKRTSDSITIYSLEDSRSKDKFRFAIRSCIIPKTI